MQKPSELQQIHTCLESYKPSGGEQEIYPTYLKWGTPNGTKTVQNCFLKLGWNQIKPQLDEAKRYEAMQKCSGQPTHLTCSYLLIPLHLPSSHPCPNLINHHQVFKVEISKLQGKQCGKISGTNYTNSVSILSSHTT